MQICARRLYLKYPLLPAADLARVLGVSRQAVHKYVEGLTEEREKRREEALIKLRRKELPCPPARTGCARRVDPGKK